MMALRNGLFRPVVVRARRAGLRDLGGIGAAALLIAGLAGCTPRGAIDIHPESGEVGSVQRILVSSLREPVSGSAVLSGARAAEPGYYDFAVSVPPERDLGTVRFSRRSPPDPVTDFATVSAHRLPDAAAFAARIDRMLARGDSPQGEVVVFIHGYNTNFAEGLYRQAQLADDFDSTSVSVNFTWASAGSVRGYAFDRESAMVARDALERTITAVQETQAKRVVIIAHSMGAQLAMETLRQMAIRDTPNGFAKLTSIVLVAPDLDIDVFLTQARPVAEKDIPIYVFASSRDRALRLSAILRGGNSQRLGMVRDASKLGDLPVAVIDTSDFEANGDPLQHFKAASSPTMIALLSGSGTAGIEALAQAETRPGLLQNSVEILQDAASAVLGGG